MRGGYAALKDDGSVVTWGASDYGGNSSSVASHLQSGVVDIFSNTFSFAALKDDGSVVSWGNSIRGGDSSSVSNQLQSGVVQIFSTHVAFAALKDDGSVITWGHPDHGADNSSVSDQLQSGVVSFADPFHNDRLIIEAASISDQSSTLKASEPPLLENQRVCAELCADLT